MPAPPGEKFVVDADPRLFAMMCALYAAEFESEVSTAGSNAAEQRLRGVLLRQQGPATEAVRAFYRAHQLADPGETLSRYVSFALVVSPPPEFSYTLRHDDLPPDVLAIDGFGELLANFYREAQVERLWAQVEPTYEREIERLNAPVAQIVTASTAYLRELLKTSSPRTFAVYVEPLVGGRINFRNYGEHFSIVVGSGGERALDEIRHAFLHFLLDPFGFRHGSLIGSKRPLLDFAARAPRLPAGYRDDFTAFFIECLVRAVELRIERLAPDRLARAIDQAEGEGYVLVRPIARELAKFEKAEPAMTYYFSELVRSIDVGEESKRLEAVKFLPALSPVSVSADQNAAERTDLDRWLTEGDHAIAAQDAGAATAAFQKVLAKYPDQPRAMYGLAIAAVLQGDADRARELFRRLVAGTPGAASQTAVRDPLILAWSHVYLGRIYDVDGNRELALSEYRAALAVAGAPETARLAAQRGIEKGYQQPRP